ncbi:MAG: hypothetical protein ACRDTA_12395 [Pseudonocardiaceae bacterium]
MGRHERVRLLLFAVLLIIPLGFGIPLLSLVLLAYEPAAQDVRSAVSIGCLAIMVFAVQVWALARARSSIAEDQVHVFGIARAKRVLMPLSVAVVTLAPLSFVAVVLGIGSGIVGAVIFFGLGVMGMLGALRLRKIEKFLAAQSESSRATG